MKVSSIFDSPCSSVSSISLDKADLVPIVNDENEIEIDEQASINPHDSEEQLFLLHWIPFLSKESPIFIVKPDLSVRNDTTTETYDDLKNVQVIKVSGESVTKRQVYLAVHCHSMKIPSRTRVLHRSNSLMGFIFQHTPLENNKNRYLILYDDFTAAFHDTSNFYLCLCQDFRRHLFNVDHKLLRAYYQECFERVTPIVPRQFSLDEIINVRKFGPDFHPARIVDIDDSLIKICFFQRKSQKEVWIYSNSPMIDRTNSIVSVVNSPKPSPVNSINLRKRFQKDKTKKSCPKKSRTIGLDEDSTNTGESSITNYYTNILLPKFRQLNAIPAVVHLCGRECVAQAEANFSPRSIRSNPFLLPFDYRWSIVDTNPRGYRTPCRKIFYTFNDIEQYLCRTESKLSIKYFVDGVLNRFQPLLNDFDEEYCRLDDLSHGKENVNISVYNDIDDDRGDNFIYVTQIHPIDQRLSAALNDQSLTSCCNCTDNCVDRMKCACFLKTLRQARLNKDSSIVGKDRNKVPETIILQTMAYQHKRLFTPISSGIYECNSKCSCHRQHCTNRLVQHGLFVQLQLFKDQAKGWGLRTLHDIPRGTFICQYIGELLTSDQGHERALTTDDKYQTSLDLVKQVRYELGERYDGEPYVIDGSSYSNLGRYFNHSCDPNMFVQNVFIDSHNLHFPNLALFTGRHVKAGQELTWNYNYELLPDREVKCYCGATNCRGRLL